MSDDGKIQIDFDGDGVPDVVVADTNGHSIYVNLKWLIAAVASLTVTVGLYLGL